MVSRLFRLGMLLTLVSLLLFSFAALFFLHSSPKPLQLQLEGDLDKDGIAETYLLADHVLTVKIGEHVIWQSPTDYHIDSFALGDVDNDGIDNLVISLWKKGSFGKHKPFWHTGEDNEYKNHLFVYQLEAGTCKQVWCSSNLGRPILSFRIDDIDGNGRNQLIVEEGQYKRMAGDRYTIDPKGATRTTVWQWEEWGFYLQNASDDGQSDFAAKNQ